MKIAIIKIKTKDFVLVPNPIDAVSSKSEIKAQTREPPFSKPVIWASPIGKAT